ASTATYFHHGNTKNGWQDIPNGHTLGQGWPPPVQTPTGTRLLNAPWSTDPVMRSGVGTPMISSFQVSVILAGLSAGCVADRTSKPGALVGSPRLRATILLGNELVSTPPVGLKFTTAGLKFAVILKLTLSGRDGFGAGLVMLLPSGPNSRNSFVVVVALFGPGTVISMTGVDSFSTVMVWRSTVPDG